MDIDQNKLLQWKTRDFNHPFTKSSELILTECTTFKNFKIKKSAVAFVVTTKLIEIHQHQSGVSVEMNIKFR